MNRKAFQLHGETGFSRLRHLLRHGSFVNSKTKVRGKKMGGGFWVVWETRNNVYSERGKNSPARRAVWGVGDYDFTHLRTKMTKRCVTRLGKRPLYQDGRCPYGLNLTLTSLKYPFLFHSPNITNILPIALLRPTEREVRRWASHKNT